MNEIESNFLGFYPNNWKDIYMNDSFLSLTGMDIIPVYPYKSNNNHKISNNMVSFWRVILLYDYAHLIVLNISQQNNCIFNIETGNV